MRLSLSRHRSWSRHRASREEIANAALQSWGVGRGRGCVSRAPTLAQPFSNVKAKDCGFSPGTKETPERARYDLRGEYLHAYATASLSGYRESSCQLPGQRNQTQDYALDILTFAVTLGNKIMGTVWTSREEVLLCFSQLFRPPHSLESLALANTPRANNTNTNAAMPLPPPPSFSEIVELLY